MLRVYKTKEEYEAIELFKKEKEFRGLKIQFNDLELSEKVVSLAESKSLFGEKDFYFMKCNKEGDLWILSKELLKSCELSEHIFLFWGKSLEFKKIIDGYGYKVSEKVEAFKREFPAELVSAIQNLDKRRAWVLLLEELETKSAEEVYGVCNWAMKQVATVISMEKFDEASGLKEFQYKNVKKIIAGKDVSVIKKVYFDLINTYNSSREEGVELGAALERWVLGW